MGPEPGYVISSTATWNTLSSISILFGYSYNLAIVIIVFISPLPLCLVRIKQTVCVYNICGI